MQNFILLLVLWLLPSLVFADATTNPLLHAGDVTYVGSFNLPSNYTAQEVRGLGLSEDGNYLYVGAYTTTPSIGKVSIPSIGGTATSVVSLQSVSASISLDCGGERQEIAGILEKDGKVIISKKCFYVNNASGGYTHLYSDTSLSSFSGITRMYPSGSAQYTNGWMGHIPTEWQSLLGGSVFAGNSNMSIINQGSNGPTLFTFDPADVDGINPIPATPLMLYPYSADGTTNILNILPDSGVTSDYWTRSDQQNAGMIIPSGTRSALFFYRHGPTSCYGTGCTDPCNPGAQAEHSYPYNRNIMAFDLNELVEVKNSQQAYHDVVPYEEWAAPNATGACDSYYYSALAYDDATRMVYVARDLGCCATKVIDVYQVADLSGTQTYCVDADGDGYYLSGSCGSYASDPGGNYALLSGLTGVDCNDTNDQLTTDCSGVGRTVNVSNLSELYAAFSSEQDGDDIVIASGTYTLDTTALSIDVDNLTIRGAAGNRSDVVIRGDAMSDSATIKSIFYFPQGAYGQNTTIKDLTVGRVGWHAIFFNGDGSGNGTTIDNVRIFDCYEQFIKGAIGTNRNEQCYRQKQPL